MTVGRIRRLADAVARLAVRIGPPRQSQFAQGLLAELDHIDEDGEALRFAAGGLWASLRMRVLSPSGLIECGRFGASAGLGALAGGAVFISVGLRDADPSTALMVLAFLYAAGSWIASKGKAGLLAGYAIVVLAFAGLSLGVLQVAPDDVPHFQFYKALMVEVAAIAGVLLVAAGVLWALHRRQAAIEGAEA